MGRFAQANGLTLIKVLKILRPAISLRVVVHALLIFAIVATLAIAPRTSIAADTTGPAQAVVKNMLASIDKLRTADDSATRANLIAQINDSLAIDSLSQTALGAEWSKLDRAEREHFRQLIGRLLEKLAYPKAAEFFGGLDIQYGQEIARGNQHVVVTTVKRPEGGAVSIDYVLAKSGGRWRVVDIDLDGQSLAQTVTGQVQAVLKQGSYKELVAQMETRLKQPGS